MAAIEVWDSPRNDREWLEFWDEFFNGETSYEDKDTWKEDERKHHRKIRHANRVHKKLLVKKNKPRQELKEDFAAKHGIKPKQISLYRLVDNGKNQNPSKPIPKREKNFFLKQIRELNL